MKKLVYMLILIEIVYPSFSQWEFLSSPSEDRFVTCLEVYDNTIYIAIQDKFYKSNNFGKTWVQIQNDTPFNFNKIFTIAKNKNNLFIGTSAIEPIISTGSFLSKNDGITWEKRDDFLYPPKFFREGEDIYALSLKGVFKYDETKNKWFTPNDTVEPDKSIYNNLFKGNSLIINDDKIIVGTEMNKYYVNAGTPRPNIYIYSINEKKWTSITDTISGMWKYGVTSFIMQDSVLLAGTTDGIYISLDGGINWIKKSEILYKDTMQSFKCEVHRLLKYDDYLYAIATPATSSGEMIYGTPSFLYFSTDKGGTWNMSNIFNFYSMPREFKIMDDKIIIAATDGLFATNKKLTEKTNLIDTTLRGNDIGDFIIEKDTLIVSTIYSKIGLYKYSFVKYSWDLIKNNLPYDYYNLIEKKDSLLFVSRYYSKFYYSKDYGKTYTELGKVQGLDNTSIFSIFIGDSIIYIGTFNGIYSSTNNGDSWEQIPITTGFHILSIDKRGDYIFAGSENNVIFKSSDNGLTWSKIIVPAKYDGTFFPSIKIINKKVYAAARVNWGDKINVYGLGILCSSDNGETWESKNNGLPDSCGVQSINYYNNYIFAGFKYSAGVFYSSDGGENWIPYNKNLSTYTLNKIKVANSYLYAATEGGMYRVSLSDFGIVSVKDYPVEKQNYLYSTMPYPIPATNRVQAEVYWDTNLDINKAEIKIYNIYGEEIKSENSIEIIPESNLYGKLIWNCEGIEPGVYIITINYCTEKKAIKVIKNDR